MTNSGPDSDQDHGEQTDNDEASGDERSADAQAPEEFEPAGNDDDDPEASTGDSRTKTDGSPDDARRTGDESPGTAKRSRGLAPREPDERTDQPPPAAAADKSEDDPNSAADRVTDAETTIAAAASSDEGAEANDAEGTDDDIVHSPIDSLDVDPPIEPDEYIARLEEYVADLEVEVAEQQETIGDLQMVSPTLDEFSGDDPIPVNEYVDTLEAYVADLRSEEQRLKKIIQEHKNAEDELEAEVRRETIAEVLTAFLTQVREPLVRSREQPDPNLEDVIDGVIDRFDDVLWDYDAAVVAPEIGKPVDQDRHSVRGTEPAEYDERSIVRIFRRGLRLDDSFVKAPEVIMSEGPPDDVDEATGSSAESADSEVDEDEPPASADDESSSMVDTATLSEQGEAEGSYGFDHVDDRRNASDDPARDGTAGGGSAESTDGAAADSATDDSADPPTKAENEDQ